MGLSVAVNHTFEILSRSQGLPGRRFWGRYVTYMWYSKMGGGGTIKPARNLPKTYYQRDWESGVLGR